jgi:hypothetical protein
MCYACLTRTPQKKHFLASQRKAQNTVNICNHWQHNTCYSQVVIALSLPCSGASMSAGEGIFPPAVIDIRYKKANQILIIFRLHRTNFTFIYNFYGSEMFGRKN